MMGLALGVGLNSYIIGLKGCIDKQLQIHLVRR